MGSNLDVTLLHCCYARCATSIVRVGRTPWPKACATQYHAQLGLPDKGLAIKELIFSHWKLCFIREHLNLVQKHPNNNKSILVKEQISTQPALTPEILMIDGNGILHPNRAGIASHLG